MPGRVIARAATAALALAGAMTAAATAPARAAAPVVEATYTVRAAGLPVMEVEARFDLARPDGYAMDLRTRVRGVGVVAGGGAGESRVVGAWAGDAARPAAFASEGTWRGNRRSILLEYARDGEPLVRRLVPPNDADARDPVPPEARRGTVDGMTAFAQLARAVARAGRCEGTVATYDGRRRTELRAETGGWEVLEPSRDAWAGRALRCAFEGRQTHGFMAAYATEEHRRPQRGVAWLAPVVAGAPPIPVRLDLESRWLGTVRATLVRVAQVPPDAAAASAAAAAARQRGE